MGSGSPCLYVFCTDIPITSADTILGRSAGTILDLLRHREADLQHNNMLFAGWSISLSVLLN